MMKLENLLLHNSTILPGSIYLLEQVLVHSRTLKHWYMVVDRKPCFTEELFNTIAIKAKSGFVYCKVVIDEMCVWR